MWLMLMIFAVNICACDRVLSILYGLKRLEYHERPTQASLFIVIAMPWHSFVRMNSLNVGSNASFLHIGRRSGRAVGAGLHDGWRLSENSAGVD